MHASLQLQSIPMFIPKPIKIVHKLCNFKEICLLFALVFGCRSTGNYVSYWFLKLESYLI